ncbi:hypothetical protein ScPMuIL_004966 [Solemya velum]
MGLDLPILLFCGLIVVFVLGIGATSGSPQRHERSRHLSNRRGERDRSWGLSQPGQGERRGRPNRRIDGGRWRTDGRRNAELVEPPSGQIIRLRGNSTSPNYGLVEVYRSGRWGIICDDRWTMLNSDVVCKQLGYSRGALLAEYYTPYGTESWSSGDILMDDVNCQGSEKKIQQCSYSADHDCQVNEAVSISCKANLDCPPNWKAGVDSCYRFAIPKVRTWFSAAQFCDRKDSHLAIIETAEENHFLSDVLMSTHRGMARWLLGGRRRRGMWHGVIYDGTKIVHSRNQSSMFTNWFPGWLPNGENAEPTNGADEMCMGLGNSYLFPNNTYGNVNYYFWEDMPCRNSTGLHFICEKTIHRETETSDHEPVSECYIGDGAEYKGHVAETTRGSTCLKWTDSTKVNPDTHLDSGLGDHNFCRNPDGDKQPWCWVDVNRGKFGYCSIPLCEDLATSTATTPTHVTGPVKVSECYIGDGAEYRGHVAETTRGSTCLKWTDSTKVNPDTHLDSGLGDHNFCRNPDGDKQPWCWVDVYRGKFGYCSIPLCEDLATSTATTHTHVTEPVEEPEELDCPSGQFFCAKSQSCIIRLWRCDGEIDCEFEEDEDECSYFIDEYDKHPGAMSTSREREKYTGIALEICARYCVYSTGYVCRSISYNSFNRSCLLSETNIQMVGPPVVNDNHAYYELRSQTLNCTDMFRCSNGKCIDHSDVCNIVDNCGDFSDEDTCGGYQPIEMRLADGLENSGRVEIRYLGEWGVVCDDMWDLEDARVVCRALGFPGAEDATSLSDFGDGNGNFLLDDVQCFGNESSLEECTSSAWKDHNCQPYETAGVICSTTKKACAFDEFMCVTGVCIEAVYICNGQVDCERGEDENDCDILIELVGGESHLNGRVEIIRNGVRGTVCDDNWDDADASVICRMLGYPNGGEAHAGTADGRGKGLIWIDEITCTGTEITLSVCQHSRFGTHDCSHDEDAWVTCRGEEDIPTANGIVVELVGGSGPNEGRVEIMWDGIRGTICDDGWDELDAKVICGMLGYRIGVVVASGVFGEGSEDLPIWLDEVSCTGTESSIEDCGYITWGEHDCSHREDAGVMCAFPIDAAQSNRTLNDILPIDCGERPLEIRTRAIRKRRQTEDDWPDKELVEKPRFQKIIGGQTAGNGMFPWQVGVRKRLGFETEDGTQFAIHWCGGTVLSEFWILSVAHCYKSLSKSDILVRTGDLNNKVIEDYEEEFELDQLIMHESYDDDDYDFDIALLKVKPKDGHGIRFNDYVQPACLPDETTEYGDGTQCLVSGWGRTAHGYPNLLKKAEVPIIPADDCQSMYKGQLSPRMFCAGIKEGGIDTCSGDSGGPFVCNINGKFTVLGATSWGRGCALPNAPGVYAHVRQLLPWIKDNLFNHS